MNGDGIAYDQIHPDVATVITTHRQSEIFWAIMQERVRQRARWHAPHDHGQGDCSSPNVTDMVKAVVLGEECGEVMRAVLERDDQQLRTELVQLAAVCTAWLELLGVAE